MPRIDLRGRRSALAGSLAVVLACAGLAGCGGSSEKTAGSAAHSSTSKTSTTSTSSLDSLSEAAQDKVYEQALEKYASCLRRYGVDVPKAASGKGSVTHELDEVDKSSAAYERAAPHCAKTLDEALRVAAGKAYESGE